MENYYEYPDDVILRESITFSEWGGPYYHNGKEVAPDFWSLQQWMAKEMYWPDVYHINERGNIDLCKISEAGIEIIESWV